MKKLLLAFTVVMGLAGGSRASAFTDLVSDIKDNVKLTIAEDAIPGYFYNLKAGRSEVGVLTNVVQYRFLALNTGYVTGYQDASRGSVLLGGSVHFDKLAKQFFPKIAALTNAGVAILAPSGINELWKKAFIGFCLGHSITENEVQYFIVTGLAFKWGN